MMERDLVLMTAVIFTPAVFALALLLFRKGQEENMRRFALLGAAVTLVLSIWLFIDFHELVHRHHGSANREESLLAARVDRALISSAAQDPNKSFDLVARIPWIQRFHIDYYLGVDGISMPLILLTSIISFLALIASWNIEKAVKGYLVLFLILETGMLGTFLALDFFLFYIFWEIMLLPMYFLIGIWGGPRKEYAAIKFFLYTLLGSVFILIAILAFYFTDLTPLHEQLEERVDSGKATEVDERTYAALEALGRPALEQGQPINTFDIILLHRVGEESSRLEARYQDATGPLRQKGVTTEQLEELQRLRQDLNRTSSEEASKRYQEARETVLKAGVNADILAKWEEAVDLRSRYQLFGQTFQLIMFLLLIVGFAIKIPVFPFHTWLPDAHVEAPTPISMILAGILLKMGGYGFLRIAYPICPWAAYELAWIIGLFGVINIVYGAFAAMAQQDFKKLVAYSSISHMGYVVLGIAVWTSFSRFQYWGWGMNGAMFQMIAHGITSAGMFFLVGVIYDRVHHRDLNAFRGLSNAMPIYSGISAVIFLAPWACQACAVLSANSLQCSAPGISASCSPSWPR